MFHPPLKPHYANLRTLARRAFTLGELLVTITILVILGAIGLKAMQVVQAQARATACASNLRQIGIAMHSYAADNRGVIDLIAYKGAGTSVSWTRYLTGRVDDNYSRAATGTRHAYLADPSITCCPALEPFQNPLETDFCYGVGAEGINDEFSRVPAVAGLRAPSRQVALQSLDRPSEYWLLVDSYEPTQLRQFWVATPDLSRNYGIHLRHADRANVLFADGHVEAADSERLKSLPYNPFSRGYNARGESVTF